MSIFEKIKHAIFGDKGPLGMGGGKAQPAPAPAAPAQSPARQSAPTPLGQPVPAAAPQVDVEAILTQKAQAYGKPSNWRTSIVDLLTLLELDSSLSARKELADDLNVQVAADGTAEQNIALHKAVMAALAKNGGKVPAALLD